MAEQPEAVARKIRQYAALGLRQAGELSIGAACELAGMERIAFLEFCKQEGVHVQTQTVAELPCG